MRMQLAETPTDTCNPWSMPQHGCRSPKQLGLIQVKVVFLNHSNTLAMSRSRHYGALSDDDDDEALVTPASAAHDDPFDEHVITRSLSGKAPGHFVSPEASSASLQQRKTSGTFARAGSLGRATDKPLSMQDKLQGEHPAGCFSKAVCVMALVLKNSRLNLHLCTWMRQKYYSTWKRSS